ncbi:hypothetical protein F5H01DRAFT_415626 [Linnemannia elongata]|nr:hypothetical protein F5H01DRAFT_415626 [Linnemannia elongata]
MPDNPLTLFCLVDGEGTSNAFSVKLASNGTVDDLKKLIRTEKSPEFDDIAADKLTIWRVSIPDKDDDDETPIKIDNVPESEKKKLMATNKVSVFGAALPESTIHVIVQRPPPVAKRDREEDAGPSSSRKRHRPHTLKDAIEEAGLTEKAVVDNQVYLSRLSRKERVSLLASIGQEIAGDDIFSSLSRTARELHGTNMKDMDKISAPHGTTLPVVNTKELYVRKAYKDLHQTIIDTFDNDRNGARNHVVVTGTSGIGKSAFLVYFAIRLLAESGDDHPPIIIFHTKRSAECYVFGGRSTVRSGTIEDFKPFLSLPNTWYFVDSSPDPILDQAKTVISASPKTLFSEAQQYQDVDKRVEWRYYMAPWTLEELTVCRASVVNFEVVPLEAVEELYLKIGGVPRYVLEMPMTALDRRPDDLQRAKAKALERLVKALHKVNDPVTLMQFFSQGRDTLEFSSRLIHCWPTDDHENFRLEWASTYVAEEVAELLTQDSCTQMLKTLIKDPNGSATGGHTFELKDLETGQSGRLEIARNPETTHFQTITPTTAGTLCIPKIGNYACVDLLLAPRDLFQITVSKNHPIKGPPLSKLIDSLIQARWIPSLDEPWLPLEELRLIFVVPSHVYTDFKKQNYLTSLGNVYCAVPADILRVKQYVLKIDVESAASGKSPGL